MKIIRDEGLGGLGMIPLLIDWRIRRCNQEGCTSKPNTIIAETSVPIFGLCEEHFQQGNKGNGEHRFNLIWDDFDAFKEADDACLC